MPRFVLFSMMVCAGCSPLHKLEPDAHTIADKVGALDASIPVEDSDKGERFLAREPISAWWNHFDDAQLAELIEAGLANNRDIDMAVANVLEARAIVRQREFEYLPVINTEASYNRTRQPSIFAQQNPQAAASGGFSSAGKTFTTYEGTLNGSWELDFLGRVTSRANIARSQAAAQQEALAQAYVIVSADIATNYMQLRGTQQRLAIARRNAGNQERTLELTQILFDGGRATRLDTARAEAQLQLTRATIPPLQSAINASIRRISVLTGQTPDALMDKLKDVKPLPSLPYTVNIGDVSSLLLRRPDVRAAYQRVKLALADYNLASTELFPTASIVGSIGYIATSLSGFGTSGALLRVISPTLNWRLFDIGRVLAEIDASDARSRAALADYEQTILLALENTQNALEFFVREEQRRADLQLAARSAKDAADVAQLRFDYGADDFLTVLDAQRTQLQAEDGLAQSNIEAATNLIGIYRALGGGWQVVDLDKTLDNVDEDKMLGNGTVLMPVIKPEINPTNASSEPIPTMDKPMTDMPVIRTPLATPDHE